MSFLPPNQQRQSTESTWMSPGNWPGWICRHGVDVDVCVWSAAVTSQQYVGGQPVMQLQLAQQQAAAGAQELYANGYADAAAAAAASSSAKQMVPPRQSSSDYR